jgi:DNA-directed RNA polymerase specialized sigma subunit
MRQRDIAEVLGVSQVHVSRLLRAALVQLRAVADQRKHDEAFDLAVSA